MFCHPFGYGHLTRTQTSFRNPSRFAVVKLCFLYLFLVVQAGMPYSLSRMTNITTAPLVTNLITSRISGLNRKVGRYVEVEYSPEDGGYFVHNLVQGCDPSFERTMSGAFIKAWEVYRHYKSLDY